MSSLDEFALRQVQRFVVAFRRSKVGRLKPAKVDENLLESDTGIDHPYLERVVTSRWDLDFGGYGTGLILDVLLPFISVRGRPEAATVVGTPVTMTGF